MGGVWPPSGTRECWRGALGAEKWLFGNQTKLPLPFGLILIQHKLDFYMAL